MRDQFTQGSITQFFLEVVQDLQKLTQADLCQALCIDHKYGRFKVIASTEEAWENRSPIALTYQGIIRSLCQDPDCQTIDKNEPDTWLGQSSFEKGLFHPIVFSGTVNMIFACYSNHDYGITHEIKEHVLTYMINHHPYILQYALCLLGREAGTKGTAEQIFHGQVCVQGLALGQAVLLHKDISFQDVKRQTVQEPELAIAQFKKAIDQVKSELSMLEKNLIHHDEAARQDLINAYQMMIDHHGLQGEVYQVILSQKLSAKSALKEVLCTYEDAFEKLEDGYQKSRLTDLKTIAQRLLTILHNNHADRTYPRKSILIGEDISAMDIACIPEENLVAIIDLKGAPHAHAIILARAMNIITLVNTQGMMLMQELEGQIVVVDGYHSQVIVRPAHQTLTRYQRLKKKERAQIEEEAKLAKEMAKTQDGHTVSLLANLGLGSDLVHALKSAMDGVGLFRTEIPFMARDRFPSSAMQAATYYRVLKAFHPKPVIIRTLDVGGDKHLPYMKYKENNPYLGWRGIRVMLDHPMLLKQQLQGIIEASRELGNARILVPMISHIEQIIQVKNMLNHIVENADEAIEMPLLGMMVEVPSVVFQMKEYAKYVDFFSVGSNDLLQ